MNRKDRGDKRGAPGFSRYCSQHQKKKNDRDRVKNDVRQMKQTGTKSVELKLGHVRNVLEREPIRGRPVSERPCDVVPAQSAIDLRNFVNVFRIVEVAEWKLD